MKFAFCLFRYFPFGGLQRDFIRIAKECVRRGHQVNVYCMAWEGEQDPDFHITVLPVGGWQNHSKAQHFSELVKQKIKEHHYDLVVGFNKMPGLDAYYAADSCFAAKQKYGTWYQLTPRYRHLKKVEKSVFSPKSATEILLLAKRQQTEFSACYQTPAHRLHLLPPGISRDRIAPSNANEIRQRVRKNFNLQDNQFLLLMVGSGFKTKGLDRALLGLASLPETLKKNTFLHIIGQDHTDNFKKLSRKLGIAEQVLFLGGRHDVPDFLLAADLLVHPAYFENTGTVLVEAMAAGLPVLTTEICGYSEYVRQENAGIVIASPFQQNEFNKALEVMLTTYDRKHWRLRARDFANSADIYHLVEHAVDLLEQFSKQRCQLSFEQFMNLEGKVFRELEGRSTKQVFINDQPYFIKQHCGIGWKEIFKNIFQFRLPVISAANEWRAINKLNQLGINTAEVVSYARRGINPAKQQSYLLMRELQQCVSLEELAKQPIEFSTKQHLLKQVATIAKTMHENGINHRDFYLCHFLFNKEKNLLYLIDLHRAQIRKKVPKRWLLKDLSGLYFSSKDAGLTQRDLFRFIKQYSGKSLREILKQEKALWQRVQHRGNKLYSKVHKVITSKELRQVELDSSVPFQIMMQGNKYPLICEKIIRVLPKKRLVVYGTWNNQAVVAKIFFEKRKAKFHLQREERGVRALLESGIDTPKIICSGAADKNRVQVILFERIMNAESIQAIWENKSDDLSEKMHKLVIELATQHVLGILQRDLHFNNFLMTKNKIYTLDAAEIEKKSSPISKKDSIENLSLFFSQFGIGCEELKTELYQAYAKSRGWLINKTDQSLLNSLIKKSNRLRWADYKKKLLRSSSAFIRHETFSKTIMFDREYHSGSFLEFLKNPEKFLSHSDAKILKAGNSSTVAEIKIDNHVLVVKRYNVKSWRHGMRRWLRQTRAAHSWQFAHLLRLFSIPTAKPVAYIENHYFGWTTKSYFIMEKIPGEHAGVFFEKFDEGDTVYSQMAEKIVLLFNNLLNLGVVHGDLKATNILIHNNLPWLIDLDGMQQHLWGATLKHAFKKEMIRFAKNWHEDHKINKLFSKI